MHSINNILRYAERHLCTVQAKEKSASEVETDEVTVYTVRNGFGPFQEIFLGDESG